MINTFKKIKGKLSKTVDSCALRKVSFLQFARWWRRGREIISSIPMFSVQNVTRGISVTPKARDTLCVFS